MYYTIHNPDILTEWRMSEQYRMEEEWAEECYHEQQDFNRRCYRYFRLKKVKSLKVMKVVVRIPVIEIDIDDDDIPF